MHAGLLAQRLNDVTLAHAAPAHQDKIGAPADEVARGQLLDLHAIEGLGIELPVEAFQSFVLLKMCVSDASLHRALPACVCLRTQQQIEEMQVRETLFLCPRKQFLQSRGFDWNPQGEKMALAPFTQLVRGSRRRLRCRLFHLHRACSFVPAAVDTPPWSEGPEKFAAKSGRGVPALRWPATPSRSGAAPVRPRYARQPTRRKRDNAPRAPERAPDPPCDKP